ncbi:alpha/beta hydrolase [Devosia sp. Root685]|uniref:alpha/beta fold hydrolase n=1 Tax=Devosia sp. Root685 TaxID=1736587 RepID=UPI0006F83CD5|nr:alpha/beta hydrolase [Devosia sp. Root685]KRB01289.1 alpha/beta hydrolase [Devosia sp. Root685]
MDNTFQDDGLEIFAADGPPALPAGGETLERNGVRVWFASFGEGPAVLLLHGGLGNSNNFGHQVPALMDAGYRVVVIDSRGHGRSSWDGGAFSYRQFADDAFAVLDRLGIETVAIVGWSDGACTGLAMAKAAPERVAGVFYFACNVDASGSLPFVMSDTIGNCLTRHRKDYAALSPQPERFDEMSGKLQVMQGSQPDYSAADLREISVPVTVAQSERDEFIRAEHARYIAGTVPLGRYVAMEGVSHFAPVQRPGMFNEVVLAFLDGLDD